MGGGSMQVVSHAQRIHSLLTSCLSLCKLQQRQARNKYTMYSSNIQHLSTRLLDPPNQVLEMRVTALYFSSLQPIQERDRSTGNRIQSAASSKLLYCFEKSGHSMRHVKASYNALNSL